MSGAAVFVHLTLSSSSGEITCFVALFFSLSFFSSLPLSASRRDTSPSSVPLALSEHSRRRCRQIRRANVARAPLRQGDIRRFLTSFGPMSLQFSGALLVGLEAVEAWNSLRINLKSIYHGTRHAKLKLTSN